MSGLEDIINSFTKEQEPTTEEIVEPTDYGNGVMYFPCIREQFAKSLAAWIGKNKGIVVSSVCPNLEVTTLGVGINGFVVVVRRVR